MEAELPQSLGDSLDEAESLSMKNDEAESSSLMEHEAGSLPQVIEDAESSQEAKRKEIAQGKLKVGESSYQDQPSTH